jgi:arabinose-5-phosphate isomerase
MVAYQDVVIAISKSGETSELLTIVPTVKKLGSSLIAMVGNLTSTLARRADIVLDCCVSREACPLDLAPTSSTTVALAMGDALAMALIKVGGFTPGQFAVFHPGGSLGRRLLLTVADLMHSGDRNPVLPPSASAFEVVDKLTATKLGGVNVVDGKGRLIGLITDGDVRRKLRIGPGFFDLSATDLMTPSPGTISPDASANEAYGQMEYRKSQISVLPVVDASGICVGLIRLHDVVGGGRE